jgi:toxin CptA
VQFQLRPSYLLAAVLCVAHGTVIAILAVLPLPPWSRLALVPLVLASAVHHVRRDALLRAASSGTALQLKGDGAVLTTRAGNELVCKVLGDSFVTPYLTVLNLRPEGARFAHALIILPDSLETESFRRLRVRLKWDAQTEDPARRPIR